MYIAAGQHQQLANTSKNFAKLSYEYQYSKTDINISQGSVAEDYLVWLKRT